MLYDNLHIDRAALPELVPQTFLSHPSRYRTQRIITASIFFLIPIVVGIILGLTADALVGSIVGGVGILLFLLFLFFEYRSFRLRGYLIRTHDISYRHGWIWRSVVSIPYNRIQHSEVSQGPLGRKMRLSTLKIFTAGGSGSDLSIGGLDPEEAQRLREWITEKTAAHV